MNAPRSDSPFPVPRTIGDVESLIALGIPESLHLDYKRSPGLLARNVLALTKDVTALANAAGGVILFGVAETDGRPTGMDAGVPTEGRLIEWIDEILGQHVSPRIDGVELIAIPRDSQRMLVAVSVPRSSRAPHQAQDNKYYKRSNNRNEPMEDYEVRDVMARALSISPLVRVDLEVRGFLGYLVVHNPGPHTARNVRFVADGPLPWRKAGRLPRLFERGAAAITPGQRIPFFLRSMMVAMGHPEDPANRFAIEVEYDHPLASSRYIERFEFDLLDHLDSAILDSDAVAAGKPLAEELKRIREGMEKLVTHSETLARIAGPTGLDFSFSSLRSLARMHRGDGQIEKLDPCWQRAEVFCEVLHVDSETGWLLQQFFASEPDKVAYPPTGLGADIQERLENTFDVDVWRGRRGRG